jgi:hypothetical protein
MGSVSQDSVVDADMGGINDIITDFVAVPQGIVDLLSSGFAISNDALWIKNS